MTTPNSVPEPASERDILANKRVERLVKAAFGFEREMRALKVIETGEPLVIFLDERDAMWLETLLVKYTGRAAHQGRDGKPLTSLADGHIRRFKLGLIEFRYKSTI